MCVIRLLDAQSGPQSLQVCICINFEMDLPDHINPDDGQAVERYLAKVAKAKATKEAATHAKQTAGR